MTVLEGSPTSGNNPARSSQLERVGHRVASLREARLPLPTEIVEENDLLDALIGIVVSSPSES
jgi:hypothetical protein